MGFIQTGFLVSPSPLRQQRALDVSGEIYANAADVEIPSSFSRTLTKKAPSMSAFVKRRIRRYNVTT